MQHTFLFFGTFLCRCFARPQLETFQSHIYGRKCRMCSPNILLLVFQFRIFFLTTAHFYLAGFSLLTASISHFFNRRYKIFMLFLLQNSSTFLSLALALSLLSTSLQTLKLSPKKVDFVVVFFSLKVWVATRFRAKID